MNSSTISVNTQIHCKATKMSVSPKKKTFKALLVDAMAHHDVDEKKMVPSFSC